MREVKLVDQLLVGGGLFQRVKVNAMQVLHDGLLEREAIVDVILHQHRHELEFAMLAARQRRSPAMSSYLSGFPLDRPNDEWLKNAEFLQRGGEGLQAVVIEGLARLELDSDGSTSTGTMRKWP